MRTANRTEISLKKEKEIERTRFILPAKSLDRVEEIRSRFGTDKLLKFGSMREMVENAFTLAG